MSNLKLLLRLCQMLLCGAAICLFLYPFLHEGGHFAAAKYFGASVTDFSLGAEASVACTLNTASGYAVATQRAVIALCGPLLPMLLCLLSLLLPRSRRPLVCFSLLLFACIANLSAFLGAFACLFGGEPTADIPVFLHYSQADRYLLAGIFLLYLVLCMRLIKRKKLIAYLVAEG